MNIKEKLEVIEQLRKCVETLSNPVCAARGDRYNDPMQDITKSIGEIAASIAKQAVPLEVPNA